MVHKISAKISALELKLLTKKKFRQNMIMNVGSLSLH